MVRDMSEPRDVHTEAQDLARDLQQFTGSGSGSGGFDPLAMLAGERQFHSVFLAPLSPAIAAAGERFLADGSGPLVRLVEQFKGQGVEAGEAAARVRSLIEHARGMLIVVLRDNQGLLAIPQLFFGNMDERYRSQAVELCGKDFAHCDALAGCLLGLERLLDDGRRWPRLNNGPGVGEDPVAYWRGLGGELVRSIDEGLFGTGTDRLADLGYWIGAALEALAAEGEALDGEAWYVACRAHCVGGDIAAAERCASRLLADFEPEDEALAMLVQHLVDAAVRRDEPTRALEFFARNAQALEDVLGGLYELELPRFKATAAAMCSSAELLAAAERLKRADRKAFRHDLNREPLWRVAVAEPGELLETSEAAERLDRSINFVAKRLDQGTIPFHRDGDQVRIPARALEGWRAVVEHYELID